MNLPNENTTTMKDSMREIWQLTVKLWWQFFDWLAVVPKKTLALSMLMVLIICSMLFNDAGALIPIFAILILIRVLAGGKRRAELTADAANKRADTEQLERSLLEARMEALQAQIEPHFLFNTLASIDQLIQTDPPRASRMQQSLIRYLRYAMPQMREGSRPNLGQQTALSSAFLEIMAIRMEGRLQPEVLVPDGLKSAVFPSMMLQTLVENAIKHGLEPKPGGGTIWILARANGGQITLTVADDGQGFNAESSGTGIGLKNLRERLRLAYGNLASFTIVANFPQGVAATLTLPGSSLPTLALQEQQHA